MKEGAKTAEVAGIILFFTALAIYSHWESLPFEPGLLYAFRDQLLHTWILGWDSWALLNDPVGLFNAGINYPASLTLALSDHLLGLLPNFAIGYLISGDYVAAHNYAFLITYVVSGTGAYLYFRHVKIHPAAAVVAAAFFAFHRFFNLVEEIQLSSFGYAFFVFLFLEKYLYRGRKRDLAGMCVFYAIGFLTGFYFAYMLTISLGIYGAVTAAIGEGGRIRKRLVTAAAAIVVTVVALSPTILPYILLRGAGVVPVPDMSFIVRESQSSGNIFLIEWMLFLCVGGGFLFYASGRKYRRFTIIFVLIGMMFLVLSLGPYLKLSGKITGVPLPYHIFRIIPGFTSLRFPTRFFFMAHAGHAFVLAGLLSYIVFERRALKLDMRSVLKSGVFILIAFHTFTTVKPSVPNEVYSPVGTLKNPPGIYRELAELKEPGPVIEFPLAPSMTSTVFAYQYFSLYHHRRIFNGNSGYTPPGNGMMWNARMSPEEWAAYLRAIGIKFIVSHPPDFLARLIERADMERRNKKTAPPLPRPGTAREPVVWMHPVEKAIILNGIELAEIKPIMRIFGVKPTDFGRPANVGPDKYIIDVGGGGLKNKPPGSFEIPGFARKEGNTIHVAHRDILVLLDGPGGDIRAGLIESGVERIVVSGHRRLFRENLDNPFLNISENEAGNMGLTKVAESGGDTIWRIEPDPQIRAVEKPTVAWIVSVAGGGPLSINAELSVPDASIWKNPNPYGINKGMITILREGEKVYKGETVLHIPLAVSPHRSFKAVTAVDTLVAPGDYTLLLDFPDLSEEVEIEFRVDRSGAG